MKKVYPDYYPQFHCVADRCRHNCCIGWEIGIDAAALYRYRRMKGPMGERIRAVIDDDGFSASFHLREDGRCPLLNDRGLCDLILERGERSLCQICRDHPRFRTRLTDREETGLGLCCEEACRLILSRREPVRLILEDDGKSRAKPNNTEEGILEQRERLLAIAQDRRISVYDRIDRLMEADGDLSLPDLPLKKWLDILLKLERMDESWTKLLQKRKNSPVYQLIDEITQEQLLVYFLYRHYLNSKKKYSLGVIPFCVLSAQIIILLCEKPQDIYEAARLYSAEIEYSDVNLYGLMGCLHEYNGGK